MTRWSNLGNIPKYQDHFYTRVRLYDPDTPWASCVDFLLILSYITSLVYYASLLGLDGVLHELLNNYPGHANGTEDLINAEGGAYGNALIAASAEGHVKVVQMLIDAGANMNAQGGAYDKGNGSIFNLVIFHRIFHVVYRAPVSREPL
jgi:hypothetical protein